MLISNGKLKRGDYFICGETWGKIRAMINYEGKIVNEALPSMPVEILGMSSSTYAGAEFIVTQNEVWGDEMWQEVINAGGHPLRTLDEERLLVWRADNFELNDQMFHRFCKHNCWVFWIFVMLFADFSKDIFESNDHVFSDHSR